MSQQPRQPRFEELDAPVPLERTGERGVEVAPRAIGPRRGRGPGRIGLVAGLVVAIVALAVWKPWGGTALRPTTAIDFDLPGSSVSLAPGQTLAGPDAGLPTDPPAPIGEQFPADYALEPVAPMIASHAGEWGLGSGAWWDWSRVPWSWWSPSLPSGAAAGDGAARIDCLTATRLPVGLFVAITAPRGALEATAVSIAQVDDAGRTSPVRTIRVTTPADRGMVYLLRADLERWATTAYRLTLGGADGPRTMEVCLFEMPPRSDPSQPEIFPVGAVPPPLLAWAWADEATAARLAPLVAAAAHPIRADRYGVGTGGLHPDASPWSRWDEAGATTVGGPYLACGGGVAEVAAGAVVAITTARQVTDPWAVSVARVARDGTETVPDGLVRLQPVTDGVVVFGRRDGTTWEPGRYRFVVHGSGKPTTLDVCLVG